MLQGIRYITSPAGKRTAVVIELEHYGELWQNFHDLLLAEQRKDEPREALDNVRKKLIKQSFLKG